ncbi:MAG: hypothetical protein OEZ45_07355 [Candidatus Aminicenantes bacterium]|nr:hypothetical protein [Candidatus Aminicenantes bacterium]
MKDKKENIQKSIHRIPFEAASDFIKFLLKTASYPHPTLRLPEYFSSLFKLKES